MDRKTVVDIVIAETSSVTGIDPSVLSETTRIDDLPLDSLQTIELTVAVEDAVGVPIGCGERVSMETLGCYVALVHAKADALTPLAA